MIAGSGEIILEGARPRRLRSQLPAAIPQPWRSVAFVCDAAAVLFVGLVVFGGGDNALAAAILETIAVCATFGLCKFYKVSYAVAPHDEIYYACAGIAIVALPVILVLSAVGAIPAGNILASLLFAAIATSAVHVGVHLRSGVPAHPAAGLSSITPYGWQTKESAPYRLCKRAFDIFVAVIAVAVFSPCYAAAALAIVLESGTPVIFKQKRVGESGKTFDIFKFRTMRKDAGPQWARPNDDRITKVGAFLRRSSLDELPQLINVLRGEMSIVGPRPEMTSFAREFSASIKNYDQRHIVAPGITGWAQVYLARNLEPSDIVNVLPYDLFYVEHANVVLDCAVLLKTIAEVPFHRAV